MTSNEFTDTQAFLHALGVGYWEWDIPENILRYSQEFISLLENDERFPSQINISELKKYICAYDYKRFSDAIDAYSRKETDAFSCDLRIRCGDGVERWFRARGKAVTWSAEQSPEKMIGTLVNIDNEKQLEISLSQDQNRFHAMVDDETIMVCRYTRDGALTFVNRTLCEFLGYEQNQVLGKSFYAHIHTDEKAQIIDQAQSMESETVVRDFECRVLNNQGIYRWLRWRNHLIIDPITNKTEFQAVGQDITESYDNLQSYNSRIEFDRLMVHLISRISAYNPRDLDKTIDATLSDLGKALNIDLVHLVIFDHARESLKSSHEWCSEGTESARDLLNDQPFSLYPWCLSKIRKGETIEIKDPDDLPPEASSERTFFSRQGIKSACAVPLQTQGRIIGFLCLNHIRSHYTWLEYTPVLIGVLAEAIANAIEGSNANSLIALNEARERLFIDAIPALIVRIDRQGRVLDHAIGCHGTLSQYVAFHAPSSVNSLDDLFERTIADQIFERLAASRREHNNKDFEFEVNVAGKPTTIEMKYSSSKEDETILVFQDISEKKNLEQLKNDFINNTTHEMRTPLTTILLMIDLMEKTEDTTKKDEYWSILKGEVMRERMLIEDLLTISRIEKGKFSGVKKQIDICAAIKEAVSTIQPQADGVGIRILTNIPSLPMFITGDSNSCQMIFSNLLSNAIKFSPQKGMIEVSLTQNLNVVQLIFKDHGIGIPADDLPGIFDRFYRGKNAVSGEIQGSGIGLFIVDHLTREMGGSVDVNSAVGRGTTFTLEFPIHVSERVTA
jgi:PAS domain S-box-containing protein